MIEMKKLLLALLCVLTLCGCAEQAESAAAAQTIDWHARMQIPASPIRASHETEELRASFGDVAQSAQLIECNIDGWHKVQIVLDYPGGQPEEWEKMCAALAAGTESYKAHTSAELVTPRGALLASAYDGRIQYDAYDDMQPPVAIYTHEGDLTRLTDATFYISRKSGYYHLDGLCSALVSRVYYAVDANTALDARTAACPICAAAVVPEAVQNVARSKIYIIAQELAEDASGTRELPDIDVGAIVYVSNRSHTIHSIPDCSGMTSYETMSREEADQKGYKYCENCW